jgi:predicted transcriptional regulator
MSVLVPSTPAALLRRARIRAALSQKDLAERAGTCQSVVARIEEGKVSPTWGTMERLLAAADQELVAGVEVAPVFDPQELDDLPRILRLTPEDRLYEADRLTLFLASARRV